MYPTSGSDIGTLLRMIQEDKNQAITAVAPGSQPGSPIRQQVQEPLAQPEAPGASHVVSTPAEGSTPGVVAPVLPTNPVPSTPGNAGQVPTGTLLSNAPTAPNVVAPITPTPVPTPTMPRIGTSIGTAASTQAPSVSPTMAKTTISATPTPAPQQDNSSQNNYLMNLLKSFFSGTLFRSSIGQPSAKNPAPTPTPAPTNKNGQRPVLNKLQNPGGWLV